MADAQKHITYSYADIERYLQGKMNATEMHEMEKAALTDAFLADAIEGYAFLSFLNCIKQWFLATTYSQLLKLSTICVCNFITNS